MQTFLTDWYNTLPIIFLLRNQRAAIFSKGPEKKLKLITSKDL